MANGLNDATDIIQSTALKLAFVKQHHDLDICPRSRIKGKCLALPKCVAAAHMPDGQEFVRLSNLALHARSLLHILVSAASGFPTTSHVHGTFDIVSVL